MGSVCSFSSLPLSKSWIVHMKWVSQDLLLRSCVQTSYRRWWRRRLGVVWFHRSVSFPKISGGPVPFPRRIGIRQWSSAVCKMKDTAGATSSAISFSNPAGTLSGHVALWDLRTRLRSSLVTPKMLTAISSIVKWRLGPRSGEFIGLLLVNTETYWFEDSTHLLVAQLASCILSKPCKHNVRYACTKFP